ncbi:MAG: S8 family serine peptidase [Candidatus Hodarchaeales archaeon]
MRYLSFTRNRGLFILYIILVNPFVTVDLLGMQEKNANSNFFPQFERNEDNSVIPYLFRYDNIELSTLKDLKLRFGNNLLRLFNNLKIGVVYLAETEVEAFNIEFKELSEELIVSKSFSTLPDVQTMSPKATRDINQINYDLPGEIINASSLWNSGFTGTGISIAVLDSGIDNSHQDFNQITYQESFVTSENGYSSNESSYDLHGHGTHVAGIAAGKGTYKGIAYDANLINLKVADMFGSATSLGFIAAIDKAIDLDVDIISISLGFEHSTPWSTEDIFIESVNTAVDHGINVIISAGNEGGGSVPFATINSPAAASKVITVGATNRSDSVADFSSQGPTIDFRIDPDVVAPGTEIVGPLANGGVIDLAYNSLVGISISDYIILSGTSMAAPVVSGAVALLKQQFKDASPHAIRAALQESAIDLGEDETVYTQGSGLINVGAAANLLSKSVLASEFDIISTLPRSNEHDLEFYDKIAFPGDQTSIMLSFITGTGGTLSWEISEEITSLISFDTSPIELSSADYIERELKVHIPLDFAVGMYQGRLNYWFRGTKYSIPLKFDIKVPSQIVYWDKYHTGIEDSSLLGYRSLKSTLGNFDNPVDINEFSSPITYSNLSNNGILVLTDLEFALAEREIEYIKEFHENNGSIVLITSYLPYFNPDPYQKIANVLNLPINFSSGKELIKYTDDGRDRTPIALGVSYDDLNWSPLNPLQNNVEKIPFLGGTALDVNLNDPNLAFSTEYSQKSVIAGFEFVNKGKILLLGSETWFQDPYLKSQSGLNFLSNSLGWLTNRNPVTNIKYDTDLQELEIVIYPNGNVNYTVTIFSHNGTMLKNSQVTHNNTLGFNFIRLSMDESSNEEIRIKVENNNNSSDYSTSFLFLSNISSRSLVTDIEMDFEFSGGIELPSWANTDQNFVDEFLEIKIYHTPSSLLSAQLLITTQYESTLGILIPPFSTIAIVNEENSFTNTSNTEKSARWNVSDQSSSGYYSYEVLVWWNSDFNRSFLINSTRGQFYIPDSEPQLNPDMSRIGDMSLLEHRDVLTLLDIPSWSMGDTINISLLISDEESTEFVVFYQLLHYYLFAADQTVLNYSSILSSPTDSSLHLGTFIVPENPIPLPDDEDFEIKVNGGIFVLLFFIRDNQGNSIIEPIFFQIVKDVYLDIPLLLVSGGLVLGFMAALIILIRRTNKDRIDPYSVAYSPTKSKIEVQKLSFKFCIYCGKPIPKESAFCGYCGEDLTN